MHKMSNLCYLAVFHIVAHLARWFRSRGGLTIWKLGHCPRARDAPGTFFIGFFEFGQGCRGPMIPYCRG
ncbi:unnamed protein product, partial [Staurois parvus]